MRVGSPLVAPPAVTCEGLQSQAHTQTLLTNRATQARETGICPVREELYAQCFDELIRQVRLVAMWAQVGMLGQPVTRPAHLHLLGLTCGSQRTQTQGGTAPRMPSPPPPWLAGAGDHQLR